jgi:hypothetical protein
MAEVVDSIIAELILKYDQYEQNVKRVIAINKEMRDSILASGGDDGQLQKTASSQTATRRKMTDDEKASAKEARDAVKVAAKEKADAEKAAAKLAADAVKAAERDKQAALKATAKEQAALVEAAKARAAAEAAAAAEVIAAAEREAAARARLAAVVAQAESRRSAASAASTSGAIGGEAGSRSLAGRQTGIMGRTSVAPAVEEAAAQTEINHALADRFDLAAKSAVAEGAVKRELEGELEYLRRMDVYKKAGLSVEQATIRAEAEILAIEKLRAETAEKQALVTKRQGSSGVRQFAEGATLGYGPSAATFAGIATAGAIAGVTLLAKQGLDYAKALKEVSDQLGISTHDLQIWQTAAAQAGVKTDQFREGLAQLGNNLGKAQLGDKTAEKLFGAKNGLNIDIGNAKDGYKNLSDILPTLIDRLSQIPDKQQRIAIETAAGGEQFAKLDPILSQGAVAFDKISTSIEKTGGTLSDKQIQDADKTAKKISLLSDQLQRDLSSTVANNTDSILGLANAFFKLADGALKAYGALKNSSDLADLNHPVLDAIGNIGTGKTVAQTQKEAFQSLLQTPQGRQSLLDRNTGQLNALNLADQGKGLSGPGLDDIPDNPQARYARHQQVLAERARILAAQKAADAESNKPPTPVQTGKPGDIKNLLTGAGRKGRKGPSPEELDAQEVQRTKQFNDQLSALQEESLRAQQSMTGSITERAADEKKIADNNYARKIDDINSELAKSLDQIAKSYPKGGGEKFADEARNHAGTLRTAAGDARDADQRARDQQTAADIANALNQHAQTQLSINSDILEDSLALAKTSKERRDIEAKLLDNAKQREKNDLQTQLKTLKPGDPARQDVQARLDGLDADYALKGKANDRANASPAQAYLNSLPGTSKEIGEALEGAAVNGAQKLNDALDESVKKMLHLHGIAGDILGDFVKIALEAGEKALFGAITGGLSGGGGGILGSVGKFLGLSGARAGGGPVEAGGTYLVGEKGPELLSMGSRGGTVIPNHAINAPASNARVNSPSPQITVLAPRHYDLSNSLIDRDTLAQMNAENRDFATQISRAHASQAVRIANAQAPGAVRRKQMMEG